MVNSPVHLHHSLYRINEAGDETHLHDPFAVLHGFKERLVGVGRCGTGSARSQEFFEGSLGLPRICKLHRHQLAVQQRVQLKALKNPELRLYITEKVQRCMHAEHYVGSERLLKPSLANDKAEDE